MRCLGLTISVSDWDESRECPRKSRASAQKQLFSILRDSFRISQQMLYNANLQASQEPSDGMCQRSPCYKFFYSNTILFEISCPAGWREFQYPVGQEWSRKNRIRWKVKYLWPGQWETEGPVCFYERQDIPREGRRVWKMWESSKRNFLYFAILFGTVNCLVSIKTLPRIAVGTTGMGPSAGVGGSGD